MKIILFLYLMIFITSCDLPNIEDNPYRPTKQSLVNEVTNKTFAQLKKEKELYPCGIGSEMMNQIRMLALGFNYYKELDIPQARDLLMTVGMLFLKNINNTEQIHPFLKNDPFEPENIEVRIFLYKKNGAEPEFDKLTVVSMIDGILKYKIEDPATERLLTIYEETYAEAEAKLNTRDSLLK